MAKEKEKKITRSQYVQKCIISPEFYTLYFGKGLEETILELPKSWFRGIKRPTKGSKITLIQEEGSASTMLIDDIVFYPPPHPITAKSVLKK